MAGNNKGGYIMFEMLNIRDFLIREENRRLLLKVIKRASYNRRIGKYKRH